MMCKRDDKKRVISWKVGRSAITGRFMKVADATKQSATSVVDTMRRVIGK